MRIAICFYGLVGSVNNKNGQGQSLDPLIAYNLYRDNIFNNSV